MSGTYTGDATADGTFVVKVTKMVNDEGNLVAYNETNFSEDYDETVATGVSIVVSNGVISAEYLPFDVALTRQ